MTKRIMVIVFLILLTIFIDKAIQGNLIRIKKIMEEKESLMEG